MAATQHGEQIDVMDNAWMGSSLRKLVGSVGRILCRAAMGCKEMKRRDSCALEICLSTRGTQTRLPAASSDKKKNKQKPGSKVAPSGFSSPGSCELMGAAEFEIVAARVHPVAACGRRRDDLQRKPAALIPHPAARSIQNIIGSDVHHHKLAARPGTQTVSAGLSVGRQSPELLR